MHAQIDYLNQIFIFSILAVSLNLLMGYAGQPSMGHPTFAAIGGYGSALLALHQGFNFVEAGLVGVVVGTVIGFVLSLPAVKLTTDYIVLLTLAALYIVQSAISSVPILGGDAGLEGIPQISVFKTPQRFLILSAGCAVLTIGVCALLGRSAYGRVLRAIREQESAAQAVGKNVFVLKATAFSITAGFAALGGVLLVYYASFAASNQFSAQLAIELFSMVIIGGSGNIWGSVVGAFVVIELTPFLQDVVRVGPLYAGIVQQIVYGLLLVIFVLLRPQGIIPERLGRLRSDQQEHEAPDARPAHALGREIGGGTLRPRTADNTGWISGSAGGAGRQPSVSAMLVDPTPQPGADPWCGAGGNALPSSERTVVRAGGAVALEVRGLKKRFGGIRAVDGVDLDIPEGCITSLIGPNGAGKSTLFGLFTGFTPPDAGTIRLYGTDVVGYSPDHVARLGMVRSFQDVRTFLRLSCLDNIRVAVPNQVGELPHEVLFEPRVTRRSDRGSADTAMEWLRYVGLGGLSDRPAGSLAYAEQKLLAIGRALATNAQVLLLDEPTSGIDPSALDEIANVIRSLPRLGRTVCIVEHNLAFLEKLGGDCYFMSAGRVTAQGGLRELMADEELRKVYFGV